MIFPGSPSHTLHASLYYKEMVTLFFVNDATFLSTFTGQGSLKHSVIASGVKTYRMLEGLQITKGAKLSLSLILCLLLHWLYCRDTVHCIRCFAVIQAVLRG